MLSTLVNLSSTNRQRLFNLLNPDSNKPSVRRGGAAQRRGGQSGAERSEATGQGEQGRWPVDAPREQSITLTSRAPKETVQDISTEARTNLISRSTLAIGRAIDEPSLSRVINYLRS